MCKSWNLCWRKGPLSDVHCSISHSSSILSLSLCKNPLPHSTSSDNPTNEHRWQRKGTMWEMCGKRICRLWAEQNTTNTVILVWEPTAASHGQRWSKCSATNQWKEVWIQSDSRAKAEANLSNHTVTSYYMNLCKYIYIYIYNIYIYISTIYIYIYIP